VNILRSVSIARGRAWRRSWAVAFWDVGLSAMLLGPGRARASATARRGGGRCVPRSSSPKKNRDGKDRHVSRGPAPLRPEVGSVFRDASSQLPPGQRLEAPRAASVCDAAPAEELKWTFDMECEGRRSPPAFALQTAEEASAGPEHGGVAGGRCGTEPSGVAEVHAGDALVARRPGEEHLDAQRRRKKKTGQDPEDRTGDS